MKLPYACPVCARLALTKSGLCADCAGQLFRLREPVVRKFRGLTVHSLFSWRQDGPKALRRLVRSLKGVEDPQLWWPFVPWMLSELRLQRPRWLVPVPSKGSNHALGFARALNLAIGAQISEPLEIPEGRQQKLLNREERQTTRFTNASCKEFTDVVIVDDIVTTGATALAAFQALGRPRGCEVWCLMDRRPCGNDAALI